MDKRAKKPEFAEAEIVDAVQAAKRNMTMKLNPQLWNNFKETPTDENRHVIDVLVGDVEHSDASTNDIWRRTDLIKLFELGDTHGNGEQPIDRSETKKAMELDKEIENMRGNRIPERIRLNSVALQHILRRFLHPSPEIEKHYISLRGAFMLRPFKPLAYFEEDIKSLKDELFKILNDLRWTQDTQSGESTEEQKDKKDGAEKKKDKDPQSPGLPLNVDRDKWSYIIQKLGLTPHCNECIGVVASEWPTTFEAKEAFSCLIEFMDTYLKPIAG